MPALCQCAESDNFLYPLEKRQPNVLARATETAVGDTGGNACEIEHCGPMVQHPVVCANGKTALARLLIGS
jgi:hypothetical protein